MDEGYSIMQARIWRTIAVPLIAGGSLSIIISFVRMDHIRVLFSEIIILLLGLLILLFEKERRYLAFLITGMLVALKFSAGLIAVYPAIKLYVLVDLLALGVLWSIGLWLFRTR